jgi:histidine triad (HIT) family protein
MDEPSVFTRIINREVPAYILHEDERVIVFLSLENHPLVVPKVPVRDIFALDDETAAAIMQTAVRVARALKRALNCDGVYLSQANGTAAGQDVFHFHLHVYPRWFGDGMEVHVGQYDASEVAREAMLGRLRAVWNESGNSALGTRHSAL